MKRLKNYLGWSAVYLLGAVLCWAEPDPRLGHAH